ncbi:MAG: phosphoribosylaminoimidazolesuccinocarboxamide synthase [Bacteroidales bacterium]|nr:phosphoribosylaminoimidazolesuccinocarboxamide synthase [Bacteroidales bacterium]
MEKRELLFDGNEKQVFATSDPQLVIFRFKDVVTAYNNVKRAHVQRKGKVNNAISSLLFEYLKEHCVDTHFVRRIDDREQLCRKIEIIPIELIVRNVVAGTEAMRLGMPEGTRPSTPIFNLRYNNDGLGDPIINDTEAVALGIATPDDLKVILRTGKRINKLLAALFEKAGITLVDLKLEFGRAHDGSIIVSDEISPDTARFWDAATGERLDKDRFRLDLGDVVASYEKVYDRLKAVVK